MKIIATATLAVSLLACSSSFAENTASVTSLFDGTTLKGWHILGDAEDVKLNPDPNSFFVRDGAIHCSQQKNKKGALLVSDKAYSSFELTLDIKSDWGCDSGIILRTNDKGEGLQILNDYLNDGSVGFIFGQGTGGYISRPFLLKQEGEKILGIHNYDAVKIDNLKHAIDAKGWNKVWKQGEWNTLKIRCIGEVPMITTWINGVKIMELDGNTYTGRGLKNEIAKNWDASSAWNLKNIQKVTQGKGNIALQIHQGGRWAPKGFAQYKNISIKEIK